MKKILFLFLMIVLADMGCRAQSSMTDSQIIEFIQKEQKSGKSQQDIVVKLMEKGVTIDKIRELKKKYGDKGGQNAQGARSVGDAGAARGRNAGMQSENPQSTSYLVSRQQTGKRTLEEMDGEKTGMQDELNGFMPDSTALLRQEIEMSLKKQRKVFGRDIFNNANLSFEPNMNIATPEDYVLGPGDQVFIDIYGASQKSVEATVTPDGDVNIEGFGPVQVSGLSVSRANARLRSQLGQRYAGSKIRLTVGSTRSIMVNVMGEVAVPGTYTLSAFSSVFHALYMAGGVSEIGTLRNIKVYRKNKLVSTVDIYDYILNGKLTGNVKLADNDVIVVGPYDCLVNVTGKVKRPMFYEMKSGESLGTAIKYAGGFTGDAYRNTVRVVRKAGKEYSVWNVAEFDMNEFQVCDEDSVGVDSVIARYSNMVELRGAVLRPGMYQIGEKVATVRDLMNLADGLQPEAMAHHAIITRTREDRSLETMAVNLKAIMDGSEADVTLKNEDVLFVPTCEEATRNRNVKIYGEVFYPGEYEYSAGMTVEDFILQAGGLKEGAQRDKVTVSRRITDGGNTQTAGRAARSHTYDVALKGDFTLSGDSGFRLEPFDEVYVGKMAGYEEQAVIEVDGEVMYRGSYALPLKTARLSDVLKLAGGVNADGWAKGARVVRKMDDAERRKRERQIADLRVYNAELVSSAFQNVGIDRKEMVDSLIWSKYVDVEDYVVGIELDKALKNPGSKYDILLKEGDRIIVPKYDSTVKVTGEVNNPTIVTFNGKTKLRHYIHAAGGYTSAGWKNHAYVVHQNGCVESLGHGAKIQPGSEVIVPVRPVRPPNTAKAQVLSTISSALASITAVLITAFR